MAPKGNPTVASTNGNRVIGRAMVLASNIVDLEIPNPIS